MKHMTWGSVAVLGVFALAGCYSYASEGINNANYNTVQATPNFSYTRVGDSDQVIVRLINDAQNGAVTSYTVSNVTPGIQVHFVANYRPVYSSAADSLVPTGDKNAQEYYVVGLATGMNSFTLTPTSVNTGVSTTVKVLVYAHDLGPALSKAIGNPGDTVVLTAPAGTVFRSTSVVSFLGTGLAPGVASRSADSSTITILLAPADSGAVQVTNVGLKDAPTSIGLTLLSTNRITTPVPSPTVAPATVSNATPGAGASITVALGGGFRFTNASQILIGTAKAGISSLSADSSTATVVPLIGSSGAVTFTGIVYSFLTGTALSLPSDNKTVTVNNAAYVGPTDPNAGTSTNPTVLTLTGSRSLVVADGGAFGPCVSGAAGVGGVSCRYYKLTTTAAGSMSGDIRWISPSSAIDLGVYIVNAATNACVTFVADNNGGVSGLTGDTGASTASCTSGTAANLAAGTYFITVVDFVATQPTGYTFRISQP